MPDYDGPGNAASNALYPSNFTRLYPTASFPALDDQSKTGEGSGDYYTVPIAVNRHQADAADSAGVIHSGRLQFVAADGHVKNLDAAWDNTGGNVSVGDASGTNAYNSVGQNSLSKSINGVSNFTMSFNPKP